MAYCDDVPNDVRRAGAQAVDIYRKVLSEGSSPQLAEMLALRQVPAARTTDDYFRGRNSLVQQYGEAAAARIAAGLAKNGYKVKPGDCYNPTAARFPFDPMAVESRINGGRDHIRRIAQMREDEEKRRQDRAAREKRMPGELPLARRARKLLAEGGRFKSQQELREAAIATFDSE